VNDATQPDIVIAVEIEDPVLADRLASLLGGVAGLRLAAPGEAATVAVVSPDPQTAAEPHGFELTPREQRRVGTDGGRRIEQGHRKAARNIGSYRQISRRFAARQARRHRPHRRR